MSIWSAIESIGDVLGAFFAGGREAGKPPEKTVAFTIAMIALSAKMAKADGVATHDEMEAFRQVFHVAEDDMQAVNRVYDQAKKDVAGFDAYARQAAKLFDAKAEVLEDVMDGLFHIAKADGVVHEAELQYLEQVAVIFGFGAGDFTRIRARHVRLSHEDPYDVLGVEHDAPLAGIKKRHRELVRENHPDRHMAAGMPPEMVAIVTERLARINAAFDRIEKERGA
jgi:DnaJ like chaperone protein